MTTTSRLAVVTLLALLAVACHREAEAQAPMDSLAPVRCFAIVDAKQLSSDAAIQLCLGAQSDAPATCFVNATDQFHELSTQKVLQLCSFATSSEPLDCYRELDAGGTVSEDQMIAFCATSCPLGPPPPQVSNAACINEALTRADLALQTAGQLCAGARSAGPVACFLAGKDLHKIADSKLVDLCAEYRRCQYYNAPAP